LIKDLPSVL